MINQSFLNSPYPFTMPRNWPFSLRLGGRYGFAFLSLPGGHAIAWNLENEPEERTVWQFSKLTLTRLETDEEKEDRLMGEEEAAYEEWYADFYSY